jgi:hypothetical protein
MVLFIHLYLILQENQVKKILVLSLLIVILTACTGQAAYHQEPGPSVKVYKSPT